MRQTHMVDQTNRKRTRLELGETKREERARKEAITLFAIVTASFTVIMSSYLLG